jgi:hypothetical protein
MSKKHTEREAAVEAAATSSPSAAVPAVIPDFSDASGAVARVEPKALALKEEDLTSMNVDVVAAASIIIGVVGRVFAYRPRMAKLGGWDLDNVDNLADYANAALYVAATNMPEPTVKEFEVTLDEATILRGDYLTWAVPLVRAGKFEQAALDLIKEGAGNKDIAADVISLTALYRAKWDEVKSICGITEAQLERGAVLGPGLFAMVSRRENKLQPSYSDGSLRVRRFWTLADLAYDQCQRAIAFIEWGVGDLTVIAPYLRPGSRFRSSPTATTPDPTPPVTPAPPATPIAPVVTAGPQLGGNNPPFMK